MRANHCARSRAWVVAAAAALAVSALAPAHAGDEPVRARGDGRGLVTFGDRGLATFGDRFGESFGTRPLEPIGPVPLAPMGGHDVTGAGKRPHDAREDRPVRRRRRSGGLDRRWFTLESLPQGVAQRAPSVATIHGSVASVAHAGALHGLVLPPLPLPVLALDPAPARAELAAELESAAQAADAHGDAVAAGWLRGAPAR